MRILTATSFIVKKGVPRNWPQNTCFTIIGCSRMAKKP